MSSALPSPANDYQPPATPERVIFTKALYQFLFGSIGSRLRALEAQSVTLESVINELRLFGLERLDDAIGPVIADAEARVFALTQQVTETAAANAAIIADFQAVTAVNLEDLAASIDAAETQLAQVQQQFQTILQGGLGAAQVVETISRVFVTPAQKAEIGDLRNELNNLVGAFSAFVTTSTVSNLDGGAF